MDGTIAPAPFHPHRSAVYAGGGMVATSQPAAVVAGLRVLFDGGNAADATVAAAAALAVTEPTSCGLGGDCFALHYDAQNAEITALNGSGRAPAALDLARLRRDGFRDRLPPFHAHTITVPGVVRGFCDLLARHGSLPLDRVLQPAIELAERGFPVAPKTAFMWSRGAEAQLAFALGGRALLVPDGRGRHRAPRVGERFCNPDLARTLSRIAADGPDGFYRGPIAAAIARVVRQAGGVMTEDDLAAHTSTWHRPLTVGYRGARIHECPPNGQGVVAAIALAVLGELFDQGGRRGPGDPVLRGLSADRLHAVIEAVRIGFTDGLARICDPAPVPAATGGSATATPTASAAADQVADLLAPDRIRALAAEVADRVRARRASTGPCAPAQAPGSDTVYLSAVDARGNACSYIQSNYMGFGTGIAPDGGGFTLQNRGHNFALDPAHPNALAPGKRPYHTIIPAMATRADGSLLASFGVMGGFMQPQGHVQVAMALLDDGLDPQLALDRPRVHLDPFTGAVALEDGIPEAIRDDLAARGFAVRTVHGHDRALFGRGQIIVRDPETGVACGGSDLRGDGLALGL